MSDLLLFHFRSNALKCVSAFLSLLDVNEVPTTVYIYIILSEFFIKNLKLEVP